MVKKAKAKVKLVENVSKTVITFTVLHRSDEPLNPNLWEVLRETDEGNAVGLETGRVVEPVAPDAVVDELLWLGNDGEFFDDPWADEEPAGGDMERWKGRQW
jgi:hypothetical protein